MSTSANHRTKAQTQEVVREEMSLSSTQVETLQLPRCICSWKNCRAYQKAFQEYRHIVFDGVVKIKLTQNQHESLAYKQCLEETLGVRKEIEWKASKKGFNGFCKYIVARHHFTEQHLRKYDENPKLYSFVKPFSLYFAKKYLYQIPEPSGFVSLANQNELLYLQCPNVPSEVVKVAYFKIKGGTRKTIIDEGDNSKDVKSQSSALLFPEDSITLVNAMQTTSTFMPVGAFVKSMSPRDDSVTKIDRSRTVKKQQGHASNSDQSRTIGFLDSGLALAETVVVKKQQRHSSNSDQSRTISFLDGGLALTETVVDKEAENKRLKNELDELRRQLSLLHSVVEKLQAHQVDSASQASIKQGSISMSVHSGHTYQKKSHIPLTASNELGPHSYHVSTAGRNRKLDPQGICTGSSKRVFDANLLQRRQYNRRYHINESSGKLSPCRQHSSDRLRIPKEIKIDAENDVVTMVSQLDIDYSEDTGTASTNETTRSSVTSTQQQLLPILSKITDEEIFDRNDDKTTEYEDDDDWDYTSNCSSTIVSASHSIKSLPRELELSKDEYDNQSHESLETEAFDSRSICSNIQGSATSSYQTGSRQRTTLQQHRHAVAVNSSQMSKKQLSTTIGKSPTTVLKTIDHESRNSSTKLHFDPISRFARHMAMTGRSLSLSSMGDGLLVSVKQFRITDPYGEKGTYNGTIHKGTKMPHGKGRLDYDDAGRWYDGDWVDGRWTGVGLVSNGDGDTYEGALLNDIKHGCGTMKYADGRIFEGRYYNGQMVQGKMLYVDGAMYDGTWHEGKRHGIGRCTFADKSIYEGEFKNGEFDGRGKVTWVDGGWYEGEWKRGDMHGHGCEISADGKLRHDGEWYEGKSLRHKSKDKGNTGTEPSMKEPYDLGFLYDDELPRRRFRTSVSLYED